MGLEDFEISLENTTEIFYSGQAVSGVLKFKLTEEKRMRGVELKFVGEACVQWFERTNSGGAVWHPGGQVTLAGGTVSRNREYFHNEETYLNQTVYLIGSPSDDMTLQPGEYSYPFVYYLPANVPSSFEGKHGHVRYVINGIINRPWRFDHRCKKVFTVICPLDLNAEPYIQQPHQQSAEKVVGCLCCKSNPITVIVNIPHRGFVPGQEIKATIEVDNQTGMNASMKCHLIQKVTYTASCGRRKEWQKVITKQMLREVFKRGALTEYTALSVPAVPASKQAHCQCIDIAYVFQVRGVLSAVCGDATVDVPISIGNIPLVTQFENIKAPAMVDPSVIPTQPQYPSAPPSFSQYPDMPPPSFAECISGKTNVRSADDSNVQGNFDFAPRYPYFFFK